MPDAGSPAGCCAMPDYWRHTTRTNTAGAVASDRAKARACHRRTVNPLQLLPILLFVVFAQKHLIAGLTAGATKG